MAVRPGSRPRGSLTRPISRSVNFSWVELVLVKRFADERGLAINAAIRELAMQGLAGTAPDDPARDSTYLERITKYATTGR